MKENIEEQLLIKQQLAEQRLAKRIDDVSYELHSVIQNVSHTPDASKVSEKEIEELRKELRIQEKKTEVLTSMLMEVVRNNAVHGRKENLHIRENYPTFWEVLLLRNKGMNPGSRFSLSDFLSMEWYAEYELLGYGNNVHFFLQGYSGASVLVEVINSGSVVSKSNIVLRQDGEYVIAAGEIRGKVVLRFRACNKESLARLLLFEKKRNKRSEKYNLAAYIM